LIKLNSDLTKIAPNIQIDLDLLEYQAYEPDFLKLILLGDSDDER
jgi:hypothetical protein